MRCDCRHRLALLGSQRSTLLLTFNPLWMTRLTAVLAYVLSCSPFAETPEQMASHEVSPGFGSPSIRRGGAGGPGEGGLYRVRAVLREEGAPASTQLPPPSSSGAGPLSSCCTGTSHRRRSSVYLNDLTVEHHMRLDTRTPWKLIPDLNPLFSSCWQGADLPGAEGRGQHWCHRLSQHWLSFVRLLSCCHGGIVQPDCLDWIRACLRVWIIQYIFSETIQSMWTEISTLLSVGLYCIGLCISIRFLLPFLFLSVCCFNSGWHIYLYRPSVLLFNTIAGL